MGKYGKKKGGGGGPKGKKKRKHHQYYDIFDAAQDMVEDKVCFMPLLSTIKFVTKLVPVASAVG